MSKNKNVDRYSQLELSKGERQKLICYLKRGIYVKMCSDGLISDLQLRQLEEIVDIQLDSIKESI